MPKQSPAAKPLMERNPIILSLLILRDMGIVEAQHPKFQDLWQPLWVALVAYRDSMPAKDWNQDLYEELLAGGGNPNKYWEALNDCLNTIWERANEAPL